MSKVKMSPEAFYNAINGFWDFGCYDDNVYNFSDIDFSKESEEIDMVNHPTHYQTKHGLEAITVIEDFTDGLNGIEACDTGNVLKYMMRWHKKNGIEDVKKAKWYIEHLIKHLEENNESAK
jgi:microsomal dipeptidase-like Zn-dependent dipeptidase